jgi:hypothetical protein
VLSRTLAFRNETQGVYND